jgi:hypothetical protein
MSSRDHIPSADILLKSLNEIAAEALRDNPGWLDEAVVTKEASGIVRESPATLCSKRTRGGGPVFVKIGSNVRYTRCGVFRSWTTRRSPWPCR